jgi:hypothetical protein
LGQHIGCFWWVFLCTYGHFDLNYMIGEDIVHLMNNWITKVHKVMCPAWGLTASWHFFQIGFPLITVMETSTGIHVCQDRYLDNGTPTTDENETIWFESQFWLKTCEYLPSIFHQEHPIGHSHHRWKWPGSCWQDGHSWAKGEDYSSQ